MTDLFDAILAGLIVPPIEGTGFPAPFDWIKFYELLYEFLNPVFA